MVCGVLVVFVRSQAQRPDDVVVQQPVQRCSMKLELLTLSRPPVSCAPSTTLRTSYRLSSEHGFGGNRELASEAGKKGGSTQPDEVYKPSEHGGMKEDGSPDKRTSSEHGFGVSGPICLHSTQ